MSTPCRLLPCLIPTCATCQILLKSSKRDGRVGSTFAVKTVQLGWPLHFLAGSTDPEFGLKVTPYILSASSARPSGQPLKQPIVPRWPRKPVGSLA